MFTDNGLNDRRRPVIGIPTDHNADGVLTVPAVYADVVCAVGGLPLLLPALSDPALATGWQPLLDGLLLAGGADLDPYHFGQDPLPNLGRIAPTRDIVELALCRAALAAGTPILGICRGLQVLCVAAGGTLLQDIPTQVMGAVKHRQLAPRWYGSHDIDIEPGTRLAALWGDGPHRVNSFHHQAVDLVPSDFRVAATAPDGVIEALEHLGGAYALGVQWHPEEMVAVTPNAIKLFEDFVAAAAVSNK